MTNRFASLLLFCAPVSLYAQATWSTCASGGACWTTGNVGIGTTAPAQSLEIDGALLIKQNSGQTGNVVRAQDSNGNTLFNVGANGNMLFATPTGTGYLAMGDGNPYLSLFFDQSSGAAGFGNNLYYNGSNWVYANTAGYGGKGAAWSMRPDGGVQLMFATNGTNPATPYTVLTALNNGNVGIGTTNPAMKLDVGSEGNGVRAGRYEISGPNAAGVIYANGNDMWLQSSSGKNIYLNPGNNVIVDAGNVGIGTTTPQHLLQVAGTIGAEEIIVSSTGADYVFDPAYKLQPLSEVADYVAANHHLPDIPSAQEVKYGGMGVGEMQTKLLTKIEELTLHLIEEKQRNDWLEERLSRLEAAASRPR